MKMEVVLSSPEANGTRGEPFRDEDVREWSRLDRLTGMLERARVETGRWRANTQDAAQSYGKMVDSRERNSADGSLVQKARRQVEIFQSQGTGGRSFQVVRASQWSSSRATDCGFDSALTDKPHNPESTNNSVVTSNGGGTNGSIPLPAPRLSLWRSNLSSDNCSSPSENLERLSSLCRRLHDEALNQQLWALRSTSPSSIEDEIQPLVRRNSSEDVSSLGFARDSKVRRSLQAAENGVRARPRNELIAERAKRFEANVEETIPEVKKTNFISTKSFTPITNNDFVKNDPNHPSKQSVNKSPSPPRENGHAVAPVPAARKANNRTVVLLRTSPENKPYAEEDGSTTVVNGTAKPVKKVEFCKTELHFAADSGKVNIVETDGKPPPTNKFRRRRRSHGLNAQQRHQQHQQQQQPGMPLVHFGDTSYEKYIFGGQGKPPPENATGKKSTEDNSMISAAADESSVVVNNKTNTSAVGGDSDKKEPRERIDAQNGHEDQETMRDFESTWNRLRANHTTTVNFLNNESTSSGTHNPGQRNVQVQFGGRSLSPLDGPEDECSVNRTTKITVRLPAADEPASTRLDDDFSNLESVRLVKGIDQSLGSDSSSVQDYNTLDGANSLRELLTKLYAKQTQDGFKFRDFKRTSDRRLLEIKDALEKSRKAVDKKATADTDKSSSSTGLFSSQVALKDLDKYSKKEPVTTNPVLLKVLASHKPILARLENDRGFNATFRNHLKKTKDDCDTKAKGFYRESLFGDRIPVYENIFDAISDGPLYENFNLAKDQKRASASPEPKKKTMTTAGTLYDKKPATKKTTEVKPRAKSTSRSATPTIASEAKRTVPKSRDSSVKRYNGKVVANGKDADAKRKGSLKSADSGTIKTVSSSNSDTLRKKKPVEVVYQTAVYNMKNEKLSKQSAKAKEAKGPRLINDLICGSKMKRPADKKVKATVGTQNTSKRKETPTMNR